MSSTRRKDVGLGATARGGSGGSFTEHERASSSPPLSGAGVCRECGDTLTVDDGSLGEHMAVYHFLNQDQQAVLGDRFDVVNDGSDITLIFKASDGIDGEDVFDLPVEEYEEIGWQEFMQRATRRESLGFDDDIYHDFTDQMVQLRERAGVSGQADRSTQEVSHASLKQRLAELGIQSDENATDHLLPTAPNGGTWRIEMEDIPRTSSRDAQLAIADQIEQFDADELFEELWDDGEVRRPEPGLKPSVFLARLQSDERYFKDKAAEIRAAESSPRELAERIAAEYPVALETQADIRDAMIAAIEADRAARSDGRP